MSRFLLPVIHSGPNVIQPNVMRKDCCRRDVGFRVTSIYFTNIQNYLSKMSFRVEKKSEVVII